MTDKTKKIIFWIVVAVIFITLFFYFLFAKPGNVLMATISGIVGLVIGWLARVFYEKKIKS